MIVRWIRVQILLRATINLCNFSQVCFSISSTSKSLRIEDLWTGSILKLDPSSSGSDSLYLHKSEIPGAWNHSTEAVVTKCQLRKQGFVWTSGAVEYKFSEVHCIGTCHGNCSGVGRVTNYVFFLTSAEL